MHLRSSCDWWQLQGLSSETLLGAGTYGTYWRPHIGHAFRCQPHMMVEMPPSDLRGKDDKGDLFRHATVACALPHRHSPLCSVTWHHTSGVTVGPQDEAMEKEGLGSQSASFIPSWLRSKLPAAIGGSKEYEDEVEQLTMDSALLHYTLSPIPCHGHCSQSITVIRIFARCCAHGTSAEFCLYVDSRLTGYSVASWRNLILSHASRC